MRPAEHGVAPRRHVAFDVRGQLGLFAAHRVDVTPRIYARIEVGMYGVGSLSGRSSWEVILSGNM